MQALDLINSWLQDATHHQLIGVIYIDVDNLRIHNDSFGHDVGDSNLTRITDTIATIAKQQSGHFSRISGGEFIIVLFDDQAQHTFAIADDICESIANLKIRLLYDLSNTRRYPEQIANLNSPFLTVSLGTFMQHTRFLTPNESPLSLAYSLCQEAKGAGKNTVVKLDLR